MEKRLYRSRTERMFAGVCGGLGHYFNIDPVMVRVLTIIIGVLTGFFPIIIAYIIMALIVPLEPVNTVNNPKQ
jgi:phage shock protein C